MTTLQSGSASDVGKVRTSNQDVAFEGTDLFAVADGMGGHVGGEVAARVAVDSLRAAFERQPSVEGLRRAVAEANRAVWRQSQAELGLRGMGTTLTAPALVQEPGGRQIVALANVGDSRAYVFSKGQVIQVTADHSLAEEKVRRGQLTQAEAAVHPHRHILTRALGVSSDVDVDLWELHLRDGDRILLCSDGLTNEVGDEQIGQILAAVKGPKAAAKALVQAALDHGGSDNVTCVVIDVLDATSAGVPGLAGVAGAQGPQRTGSGGAAGRDGQESSAHPGAGTPGAGTSGAGGSGPSDPEVRSDPPRNGSHRPKDEPGASGASGAFGAPTRALRVIRDGDRKTGVSGASPTPGDVDTSNGAPPHSAEVPGSADADGGAVASDAARAEGGPRRPPAGPIPAGSLSAARLQAAELRRLQPTRHDRRRRRRRPAGASRIVTVRVVLFVILLLGVVAAAYAAIRWYAMDEWYVSVDHGHLAVYQGRPGGVLWFRPQLVDETPVTTHEVLAYEIPHDRAEPSLVAAERYVKDLRAEYLATRGTTATGLSSGSTPTTTPPSTSTGAAGTTPTTAGALALPPAGLQ